MVVWFALSADTIVNVTTYVWKMVLVPSSIRVCPSSICPRGGSESGGAEDHRSVPDALSGASLIVSQWQPLYLYTLCSCHLDMISPFNIFVRSCGLVFTLPPSKRPRKRGALFGDRLAMEAAAIWNGSFVRWHRSRASSQHITWLCLMMGGGGGLCLL